MKDNEKTNTENKTGESNNKPEVIASNQDNNLYIKRDELVELLSKHESNLLNKILVNQKVSEVPKPEKTDEERLKEYYEENTW